MFHLIEQLFTLSGIEKQGTPLPVCCLLFIFPEYCDFVSPVSENGKSWTKF